MGIDPISIGIQVALTVASMAITASQHFEGPRVSDLKATSADYGTPLVYFKGRSVFSCPVFWAEPLVDNERETKSKGGKMTTHYATGTCAVHIADHPIDRVLRIWADEHLIYDRDAETSTFQFSDDYNLLSHLRFYTGDQTVPDFRMQATVEAEHGAGTCPAYINQSYFVVEDVPLDLIGNRYPQWRVEAEVSQRVAFPMDVRVTLPNTLPANTNPPAPDRQPQVVILVSGSIGTDAGGFNTLSEFISIDTTDTTLHTQSATVGGETIAIQYQLHSSVSGNYVDLHITSTDTTFTYDYFYVYPQIWGDDVSPWNLEAFKADITNLNTGVSRTASHTPEWSTAAHSQLRYDGSYVSGTSGGNDPDFYKTPVGGGTTLSAILDDLSARAGLESDEYDFSALDQSIKGFRWTQGTPKQIAAYLLDVYDCDIVPHDFALIGKKRTGTSLGSIQTSDFVAGQDRYTLPYKNDRDLPRSITFNFSDYDADQNPNTASPQPRVIDATVSQRTLNVDGTALAMTATEAKRSVDKYHRRIWGSRVEPQFALTRQYLALEPGDVWTPDFDGVPLTARATKLTIGAGGTIKTEWAEDDPVLAGTSTATGAAADGHVPSLIFNPPPTLGAVLDLPLLTDAHDQAAPFAYVAAGPEETGPWPGAVFSQSDTGAADSFAFNWDSVGSSGGTVFGATVGALPEVDPWVVDNGSSLTVSIDSGALTSSTMDAMLDDGTINLAAIESGTGYELIQFETATLVDTLTYTLTGLLRGARGTEQYVAGHATGDQFILLTKAKVHTLGASEIGDTDSYVVSTAGKTPNEADAFTLNFAGNAHRPYAAVNGSITDSGSDKLIDATRRTRIGGSALNGQDVPLGEASESWQADIYDGVTFKRTLSGTSLPLTYNAADIATDAVSSLVVKLYQMNPTLSLRGFPLTITP